MTPVPFGRNAECDALTECVVDDEVGPGGLIMTKTWRHMASRAARQDQWVLTAMLSLARWYRLSKCEYGQPRGVTRMTCHFYSRKPVSAQWCLSTAFRISSLRLCSRLTAYLSAAAANGRPLQS